MTVPGFILLVGVVAIIFALVFYLVSVIVALQKISTGLGEAIAAVGEIIAKTEPVKPVVDDINANLDAAVGALEGLLVKKAGIHDAVGLVDGLYPGAGAVGFRELGTAKAPRIGEVYTRGTLTLARLGREAPIAAGNPAGGPVLRNVIGGSLAARMLYPAHRPGRSPVIGTDAPVRYEAQDADPSAV